MTTPEHAIAPSSVDLLARVRPGDVRTDPFPHVVVRGALHDDVADRLLAEYPSLERITGPGSVAGNERHDLPAAEALADPDVSDLWKAFVRVQTGNDFVRRLFAIFAEHLPPGLHGLVEGADRPTSRIRNVDDQHRADVEVDAQISVNTPVAERSTVKGPHVDRPIAVIPGLYYLRPASDTSTGGDLELYRPASPHDLQRFDGQHVPDDAVQVVDTVPYEHNTLVLFVNSIRSLHGVTPRDVTDAPRLLANLVTQVAQPHFDLGAHQLDRERWRREHPWEEEQRRKASLGRRVVRRVQALRR